MREAWRGVVPEAEKRMDAVAPERIKELNPETEKRIRVRKHFEIGGVEIDLEKKPKEPEKKEMASFTKAAFLAAIAHGGALFALHESGLLTEEPKEENKGAEVMAEIEAEGKHNMEVRETLENERKVMIDHLIDVYLDPSSPEYGKGADLMINGKPFPSEQVFLELDAQQKTITFAEHSRGKLPSVDEMHARTLRFEGEMLADFDTRFEKLLNDPDYHWTGDVEQDLVTLRDALMKGPDRFFFSPRYEDTKYQKDSWSLSSQMTTGTVQCQESRMDPLLLARIYEAKGINPAELSQLRAAVWSDHIETGIELPDGSVKLFEDMSLASAFTDGLDSPYTGDDAVFLPLEQHLVEYLAESGADKDQLARVQKVGYLPDLKTRFLSSEPPAGVVDFARMTGGERGAASDVHESVDEKAPRDISYVLFLAQKQYVHSQSPRYEEDEAAYFIEIPEWISDEYLRNRYLREDVMAYAYVDEQMSLALWSLAHEDESRIFAAKMADQQYRGFRHDIGDEREDAGFIADYFQYISVDYVWAEEYNIFLDKLAQDSEMQAMYSQAVKRIIDRENKVRIPSDFSETDYERYARKNNVMELYFLKKTGELFVAHGAGGDTQATLTTIGQYLESSDGGSPIFALTPEEIHALPKEDILIEIRVLRDRFPGMVPENLLHKDQVDAMLDVLGSDVSSGIALIDLGNYPELRARIFSRIDEELASGGSFWGGAVMEVAILQLFRQNPHAFSEKYPHIYQTLYADSINQTSAFDQAYMGMHEEVRGVPYKHELTKADLSGIMMNYENPEMDQDILNSYLAMENQQERMEFLDWIINCSGHLVVNKKDIYSEDLALLGDKNLYPRLTLIYRPELLSAGELTEEYLGGDYLEGDFQLVLETNIPEASRLIKEADDNYAAYRKEEDRKEEEGKE